MELSQLLIMKYPNIILYFILLLSIVSCQSKYDIEEITSKCTLLVKELDVKGTDSLKPTKEEAEESLEKLGAVIQISKIKDHDERDKQWAAHPDLLLMVSKLQIIRDLLALPKDEREAILEGNQEMLESVVKLSMLDSKNPFSPTFGMKIAFILDKGRKKFRKAMNKGVDKAKAFGKKTGKKLNNTFSEKSFKKSNKRARLVFSKVIKPK